MDISVKGLRIYLLMLPIVGISVTGSNYIQSIGEAKIAMFLSLLRQVILLVPFIIILPRVFGLGLNGVWIAQPLSDLISSTITAVILIRSIKHKEKVEEIKLKKAN